MSFTLAAAAENTASYEVPGFMYAILVLTLGVYAVIEYFHGRHDHIVKFKEAVRWSVFYISIALLFAVPVYLFISHAAAAEYLAAWGIEKALSLDNLFVFGIIFAAFKVEQKYRHRILNYGIAGAIFFRLVFILVGIELLQRFAWISAVFGLILIRAAWFAYRHAKEPETKSEGKDLLHSRTWAIMNRLLPIYPHFDGNRLTKIINGKRLITMMTAVIIFIELTDIIFAIDSIPAVLAVTASSYIAYASNLFAVLGLRSLYFVYDSVADRFWALNWALALILLWIGAKMILAPFELHLAVGLNLAVIFATLAAGVGVSLAFASPQAGRNKA